MSRAGRYLYAALIALCSAGCAASPRSLGSFAELSYDGYHGERSVRSRRARADVVMAELGPADATETPIVLLHPWGTNMLIWRSVAPALALDRRVLLVDLPGHGKSSKPPGRYPPKRLAGGVLDAMDAAGIDRAIIAGNSLGGATAIALALEAPERVRALILIGSPGGARVPDALQTLVKGAASPTHIAGISDEVLGFGWLVVARGASPLATKMLDDLYSVRDGRDWAAWSHSTSSALREVLTWSPPLARISAPALVVQGTEDIVVWPSRGADLAAGLPAGRYSPIDGCGHMPEVECPEELLLRASEFIRSLPADPAR